MDLERIKQNLRLRSGRPKKKKSSSSQPSQQHKSDQATVGAQKPPVARPDLAKRSTRDQYSQTEDEKEAEIQLDGGEMQSHQSPQPATTNSDNRADMAHDTTKADPHTYHSDGSDGADFDLRPPAPRARLPSLEVTAELLFSSGHLDTILHDPQLISRFTAFLNRYRPDYQPLILRYLETQKAIRAVEYANAVAAGATTSTGADVNDDQQTVPGAAAQLDKAFEQASTAAFSALVGHALPLYITYRLVKLASECLINEVSGKQSEIMQSLVGGLSEVFCITDPNLPDNPIIYASEEFYRYTGYESEQVIGNNCRFLQGPKTLRDSPRRIKEATKNGSEICETLLNYRRDGRPFINLLMIAPLHDNEGRLKYQIGAQVDVSGLVEKGRGLDSFARYLGSRSAERGRRSTFEGDERKQNALNKLRELSEMFDLEESAVVQTHSRANSSTRSDASRSTGGQERPKSLRRLFVSDSRSDNDDDNTPESSADGAWALGQQGPQGKPSGNLPGIYDTYMLIRPAPSLRIIFVSPKLQKWVRKVQSPFLSHVAAPARTLAGLKESFVAGMPVSAKINFMAQPGDRRDGFSVGKNHSHEDGRHGKAYWISATPLLGSDDRPGVWMVVFVEKSKVPKAGATRTAEVEANARAEDSRPQKQDDLLDKNEGKHSPPAQSLDNKGTAQSSQDQPIKPTRLDGAQAVSENLPTEADGEKQPEESTEVQADHQTADHSLETRTEQLSSGSPSEFVETKADAGTHTLNNDVPDRIVSQSSPGHGEEPQKFEQQHKQSGTENEAPSPLSRQRSDTGSESTPRLKLDLTEQRKFTPPPDIDSSLVSPTPRTGDGERADFSGQASKNGSGDDIDDTPVATRIHTRRSSGEKDRNDRAQVQSPIPEYRSPSEHPLESVEREDAVEDLGDEEQQDVNENPSMRLDLNGPNGLMMDYLTHPGSGKKRVHADEFGRALQERGGTQGEDWSDSDCLRTPYSVD